MTTPRFSNQLYGYLFRSICVLLILLTFTQSPLFSQSTEDLKTDVFPSTGLAPFSTTNFSFSSAYSASGSYWALPFSETTVYQALMEYTHPTNADKSYALRVGKGGHIYSLITSAGESVAPQWRSGGQYGAYYAPWVDEVWQMVAVDGSLNDPTNNKKYFIHQSGVYLKTPEQTQPFFSPIVAEYYDSATQSYRVVNWGQQAHTEDNVGSGYTSNILYYTQYKNLGEGIIQVDYLMYNYGSDNIDFINIPWGGVRQSTYDHWFYSNPDHTYAEGTGNYSSAYVEPFTNTGGWAAFSTVSSGNGPALGLLMDNSSGTLRLGDAGGDVNTRNYTVFEGIKHLNTPATALSFGRAARARNYFIFNSSVEDIKDDIINKSLENNTFYGLDTKTMAEAGEIKYFFEYQGAELVAVETSSTDALSMTLQPFQNSYPLFIVKSSDETFRITTDLYTYSGFPYDGSFESAKLLGFSTTAKSIKVENVLICSGENYTFPDGSTQTNITTELSYMSNVGAAYNGYDSLVCTNIFVTPVNIPPTDFDNNGPGGIGSTQGASSLYLWLTADNLDGTDAANPSNGTSIDEWSDRSGYVNHYSNTNLNRPTYSTSGTYPAVNFDPNAANVQYLSNSNPQSYSYGSVYFAFNPSDAGSGNRLLNNASYSLQYEQSPNTGVLGYSEIGVADYSSSLPASFGSDKVLSFHSDCATNQIEINLNNSSENLTVGNTISGIPLGSLGTAGNKIGGDFYEVIAYVEILNTAQKIILDNYLSAKYGNVSIQTDLYNEDEAANGNFDHDVAGIGRIDVNAMHEDARGTGVLRIKNATDLGDGEFLFWGNNGSALTFTEESDISFELRSRIQRQWAISEVNTSNSSTDVGAIDLRFDLSGVEVSNLNSVVLLIDTDGDGLFADETHVTNSGTVTETFQGQADVLFNGITNLQDNHRFTLGLLAPDAPGGVYKNLAMWLDAGSGTTISGSSLTSWAGKSENPKTGNGIGATYNSSTDAMINYNPVIRFDGTDDYVSVSGGLLGTNTYTDVSFFIIHRLNAAPHNSTILLEHVSGGSISSHLPWSNGRVYWDAGLSSGDGRINQVSGLSLGDIAMWGYTSHDGSPDAQSIRKNGAVLISDNTAISITGSGSNLQIGSTGGGLYSNGDIAEMIAYVGNTELQSTDLQAIESYLALKYGITKDNSAGGTAGDYVNSAGTLLWDSDANSSYHQDVIGINRDDNSQFLQKQSKTLDDNQKLYMGSLAASNSQNTGSINNDLSSLILGHNNGSLSDPGNSGELPMGITTRIEREWKVTNYNFIDNYTIEIVSPEASTYQANDIRLLIDEDGDFSNANIYEAPYISTSGGSFIISGINASVIPINSTRYFAIASTSAALSVNLLNFQAILNNKKVHLKWHVSKDSEPDYFEVERSENKTNWTKIAQVTANSQLSTDPIYEVFDEEPLKGNSYYRLKLFDADGNFTYSKIRVISNENSSIRIFPNPVTNQLIIEGEVSSLKKIQLKDMLGLEIPLNSIFNKLSQNQSSIDVKDLNSGIYFLKIDSQIIKFLKI